MDVLREHFDLTSRWQLLPTVLIGFISYIIIRCLQIRYRPGLRKMPGPWLASFSDLDRLWSCAKGLQMNYHLRLHKKYGPLVRVGPKHVSFSDCALIPKVYGIGSGFWKASGDGKSDFYLPFDIKAPSGMVPTVFSVRDENAHRSIRRPIANAFALSTLKELEPMNDACSEVLMKKFEEKVGQSIDMGTWLHWYAFDVITSITYSNTLGMMSQERDIENIISAIEGRLVYNSIIGQAPYLHKYLFGNDVSPRLLSLIPAVKKMASSRYIVEFARKQMQRYEGGQGGDGELKDMLHRFKRFKDEEEVIDEGMMLSHSASNIFAGSDTTAASLRAVVYYLCRTPSAHKTLLAEIDSTELSDPVTFSEAQAMPYLQAVIKEALRMHPAVGLLLERLVPKGGAELGGIWLEEGTVVGMNPWVSARDEETYGVDADVFRPERWIEADEERLKLMERNFLAFGAGARTCLGKNISILEMSKLIPQLYRRFDFELTDPRKEWTLHDYWFVRQTGLICTIKRRNTS